MKCSWLYRHTFFAGFCTFSWSQQVLFWINWCGANIASFCASFVGFTIIFKWKNTFDVCGIMKNCIFFTNSIEFIYTIDASMSTFPTLFDFFSFDNSLAWICKRQIKILYLGRIHLHPTDESSVMDLMDDSSINFWTRLFFIFCQNFAIFDDFSKFRSGFSHSTLKNGKKLGKKWRKPLSRN